MAALLVALAEGSLSCLSSVFWCLILVLLSEEVYTLFLPRLLLYPPPAPPTGAGRLTGGPGSLKDLLLATPEGAGLWDFGTRDFPVNGFLDLDLGSTMSVSWSLESFLFTLDPMENLVIFLSVFFSMVDVFSWGELLPELEDLSAVLALELAVPEV